MEQEEDRMAITNMGEHISEIVTQVLEFEDMLKEPKGELKWRARQKPGHIMKPSTFRKIAESKGVRNPSAVAGAAYWNAVKAGYKESKK